MERGSWEKRQPPRWISKKGLAHFCRTKMGAISCPHKTIFGGGKGDAFCSFILLKALAHVRILH